MAYHIQIDKCTVCITFLDFYTFFENSVDPDQLASSDQDLCFQSCDEFKLITL